jgi:hypothetical protein
VISVVSNDRAYSPIDVRSGSEVLFELIGGHFELIWCWLMK